MGRYLVASIGWLGGGRLEELLRTLIVESKPAVAGFQVTLVDGVDAVLWVGTL